MPHPTAPSLPLSTVSTILSDTGESKSLSEPELQVTSTRPAGSEHIVHFYQDDGFLITSLVHFLSAGIQQHDICLVIATLEHQRLLKTALAKQFDLKSLESSGALRFWDAAEQANQLIVNGQLDRQLFADRFGTLIAQLVQDGQQVRGFGEIVSLLWANGLPGQAVELEKAWHALGDVWPFTLLCAYSLQHVSDPNQSHHLDQVCQHHTQSIPEFTSLQSHFSTSGEPV